jgi:uncharacterized membrane protein
MTTAQEAVDVDVPVTTAYNQWTQFAEFPQFMDGVESVTQLDERRLHWKVSIGGVTREFDAEITEQHPDERIAWKSVDGTSHAGVVTFHKLTDAKSRVMLQLEMEPEGLVEKAGDKLGIVARQAKSDMANFKKFIESRNLETGAWRGDVPREG